MKYDDPELRERLAADYALGTLAGPARRRFQRLMREDPALAEAVARWEMRLNPLVEALAPVEPPAEVWQKVERRIARPGTPSEHQASVGWFELWHSLRFWRSFGLAAGAAALLLAIYVGVRPPLAVPERAAAPGMESLGVHEPVAVLKDAAGRAAWLVAAEPRARRISVRSDAAERPPAGRVYELWLLPKGGAKPRPLGLLPAEGPWAFELAPEDAAALAGADGLAISLEPASGSPTGLPTGPFLFKGSILTTR